ncbi:uncharacterized protein I303_105476 [Kwoniella dejecticola CBS 10117]|uniref:Uncharacterized protein n=1 Tax=Kwoniella dejecticola CBS 10117 TaxID=1296121 RepID=A0AAJ8KS45_9TREE
MSTSSNDGLLSGLLGGGGAENDTPNSNNGTPTGTAAGTEGSSNNEEVGNTRTSMNNDLSLEPSPALTPTSQGGAIPTQNQVQEQNQGSPASGTLQQATSNTINPMSGSLTDGDIVASTSTGFQESTNADTNANPTTRLLPTSTNPLIGSSSSSVLNEDQSLTEATRTVGQSRISSATSASSEITAVETTNLTSSTRSTSLPISLSSSSSGTLLSPVTNSTISASSTSTSSLDSTLSSSSAESTSSEATSTEAAPTETSPPVIVTISAGKDITLTQSITSTPPSSASATDLSDTSKEAANDNGDNTSILNTQNKLFPLGVILVVAGGIVALVTILWFLMKVFGITRRRQRLRGAIPSFVPPERIEFQDDKFDPTPPSLSGAGYPYTHTHDNQQDGYVDYPVLVQTHQRGGEGGGGSNSSWEFMGNDTGYADGRSITPMDNNLAGVGVGRPHAQPNMGNGVGMGGQGGQFDHSYQPHNQGYDYDYDEERGRYAPNPPQQYNPFMIDQQPHQPQPQQGQQSQGRDLIHQRNGSQSSNGSGKLGKSKNWENGAGAGGYV